MVFYVAARANDVNNVSIPGAFCAGIFLIQNERI